MLRDFRIGGPAGGGEFRPWSSERSSAASRSGMRGRSRTGRASRGHPGCLRRRAIPSGNRADDGPGNPRSRGSEVIVYQWLLITKDAHGVYEKLGFRDGAARRLDGNTNPPTAAVAAGRGLICSGINVAQSVSDSGDARWPSAIRRREDIGRGSQTARCPPRRRCLSSFF